MGRNKADSSKYLQSAESVTAKSVPTEPGMVARIEWRDKRHKENMEFSHQHGLDKLLRPEEVNELLDQIVEEATKLEFLGITEVGEAIVETNKVWREAVERHRVEEV